MALDWRNDNTIRYLLQGNVVKVIRQLEKDMEPEGGIATGRDVQAVMADARELRNQILAAAGEGESVETYMLRLSDFIESVVSGMGRFVGEYDTEYDISSQAIEAFFNAVERIQGDGNTALEALTTLQGQIRLGILHVPQAGQTPAEDTIGIAIGQRLTFTGAEWSNGSQTYYELDGGNTFAFYTSTGWQYWLNGQKRGWYDSRDGMLHVVQIQSEGDILFGKDTTDGGHGKWQMTEDSGWGIRYLGG